MKTLFSLIIFQLVTNVCYAQLLEGSWKGSYTLNHNGRESSVYYPIQLDFILTNDSTYAVYSYSEGHSKSKVVDKIKCSVQYVLFTKDSIYLKELEILAPHDANPRCMKEIFLKVIEKKRIVILDGMWFNDTPKCNIAGTIIFSKRRKKISN
jgi:hypothetical protein